MFLFLVPARLEDSFLKSLSERFAQIVKISTYIQQSYGDVFDLLTEMRKILDIWK